MFEMLFTITVYIGFIIILRFVCKDFISARLRYALWLLVVIKLLVFPMPNLEGSFSVLGFLPAGTDGMYETEELSAEALAEAEGNGMMTETELAEAAGNGNLWGTDAQAGDGTNVTGTDYGAEPEYYAGTGGRGLSSWEKLSQMTKLRLRYYIKNVLKVPVWVIWVLGAGSVACALVMAVYHLRLRAYLRKKRVRIQKESLAVYAVAGLPTPCLFGKSIYIPERLAKDEELLPYILKHELCHYTHGDHIWGAVRMLCVCLYWYHPLVWAAAYLSRQDCELACDESVVKNMAGEGRKRYGELLLELAFVKSSPADCFSMTTAMSGNAKNLKERLQRITGKKKGWLILGFCAALLGVAGIYACMTSGFVSTEKQWQTIEIREQEGSIPIHQESYEIAYRLSRDAASCGLYMEAYEYGELVSAEVLDCMALAPDGEEKPEKKRGEGIYARGVEAEEVSGAYVKSANSYSVPDYSASDGASSTFKAFTLNLPENCIGNSFSFRSAEKLEHRFRMNEDIILLADYYGDEVGLSVPGGHEFEEEKYWESAGEVMKRDRHVILTHLIVSDKSPAELEKQLEALVENKMKQAAGGAVGIGTADDGADAAVGVAGAAGETAQTGRGGFSDAELLEMAGNYYRKEHGFTPTHVEIDSEDGAFVTIWLYDVAEYLNEAGEIVGQGNTGDWYTVDRATGHGENVLFEEIDLTEAGLTSAVWDKTERDMSVTDVSTPEAFGALPAEPEAGAENRLYLLGETESYVLYGAGDYESMIVKDGDAYTKISVPFITDGLTMQMPEIQEADYDGDGAAELAVRLLWGEGTGIWKERLWMFDKRDGLMKAYEYRDGEFAFELLRQLSWGDEDGGRRILLDEQPISPKLREEDGVSYREMSINTDQVSFAFQDGKIWLRTLINCGSREDSVMPAYGDACMEAEVLYLDGGRFSMLEAKSANMKDMNAAAEKAVREFYAPREIELVKYGYGEENIYDGEYVYNKEAWIYSADEGERAEITVTVLEEGMDSYDFATVQIVRDDTGSLDVRDIWVEK